MGRWLGALCLAVLFFGASVAIAPRFALDGLIAYAIAFACVGLVVVSVALATPNLGRAAGGIVIGAVILLVGGGGALGPDAAGALAVLVLLLAAGTSLGAAIGARIEHAGHLGPVAIVSSVADVASVVVPGAPSHEIVASAPLLSRMAISWPIVGTRAIAPLLGVGDVAFVALYLAASRRHALGTARTALALGAGLTATAVVVAATEVPLPALPFLAAAVLVAHPEARRPPARDRRAAAVGIAVTTTLAIVAWWARAR